MCLFVQCLTVAQGVEQYSDYAPRLGSVVGAVVSSIAAGAAETLAVGRALLPGWRAGRAGELLRQLQAARPAPKALPAEGVPAGVPSKLAHAWMEDQRVGLCLALCPRCASRASMSLTAKPPCRSALAALADSQGRVVVFDVVTCVVLWMLKGYRDAQVAWSVVDGRALLYVYAPLRAAVELWDGGTRVGAWSLPAVPHGQRAPPRVLLSAPASVAGHSVAGQAASTWLLDLMNDCVFSL